MYVYRSNVVVTLVLVVALVVFLDRTQLVVQAKMQSTQYYCGKGLADALSLLCNGNYNGMFSKKDDREMEIGDYPYGYNYPALRSKASATAMIGNFGSENFRRASRGVYDECCHKKCSIEEMKTYCRG